MSLDPLQRGPEHKALSDVSSLKFAKLHSPKMKSIYWRYFGFPTNESDRIITKQNVVCVLCHKVLTNHGNTTNLRAHLQHRHKDIFSKVCSEFGIKIPPRKIFKTPTTKKNADEAKRDRQEQKIKLEYDDKSQDESSNTEIEEQTMLYETMVPMTYEDDELIDSEHFAKVEVGSAGGGVSSGNKSNASEDDLICRPNEQKCMTNYRMDDVVEIYPYQLQESLVNMLVMDIGNVSTLNDPGMTQFVKSLSGNLIVPSVLKIETLIKEMHSDKLTGIMDEIKFHSQIKPFSLGFEIWTNIEQKHFLSIYFNHMTDDPQYNLSNRLYTTLEYNKYTSIDGVFEEFNLHNCTAAIVNYDYDDYLKHFLRTKNIPIILSYDVIVDKCLRNVFALPAVASVIDEVKDVIMRYTSEINSKDVEIPTVHPEFPWTHYELLKFFAESVSWPDDVDHVVASAKTIVDVLSSLDVTLNTLKGEEIPHCSMLSPITSKILNKKLAINDGDEDDFITTIKSTIAAELQQLVIEDDQLTIAALLDPRFHRLTNTHNMKSCLAILTDKYKNIKDLDGSSSIRAVETNTKRNITSTKKSNLELFFDIQEQSSAETEESNVENDMKRYRNEVYVSLDESPISWWNKLGHLYGSLKSLSQLYQCLPCVVNMNFKKSINQQITEHQKRFMLTGSLIDSILFLHDNFKVSS